MSIKVWNSNNSILAPQRCKRDSLVNISVVLSRPSITFLAESWSIFLKDGVLPHINIGLTAVWEHKVIKKKRKKKRKLPYSSNIKSRS